MSDDVQKIRAQGERLLECSEGFMRTFETAPREAERLSYQALSIINDLALLVRNYQDTATSNECRNVETGQIIYSDNRDDAAAMVRLKDLPPAPTDPLNVRDALNKFAHFDREQSTFAVIGDRHFMLLSGKELRTKQPFWVARIEVSDLVRACNRSAEMVQPRS